MTMIAAIRLPDWRWVLTHLIGFTLCTFLTLEGIQQIPVIERTAPEAPYVSIFYGPLVSDLGLKQTGKEYGRDVAALKFWYTFSGRDLAKIAAPTVWWMAEFAGAANARLPHRGTPPQSVAPVLQNQTVNMGLLTRTGRGGVKLNSSDITTVDVSGNPLVTFSGLDLQVPLTIPCATFTVTFNSGRSSGDFTLIAADTPVASAITPVVAAGGQGNLTGNYVFNVSCKDAGGNVSNTVTLTYTGVANAVNWGDQSGDVTFGIWPSGFGNVAGAKVLISTGYNRMASRVSINIASTFTNQVTWQNADVTRPAAMTNLQLQSMTNVRMLSLIASGDLTAAVANGAGVVFGFAASGGAYSNAVLEDTHGYFNPSYIATAINTFGFQWNGCTSGCGGTNNSVDYIQQGVTFDGGTAGTINGMTIRHFYQNGAQAANTAAWTINDLHMIAPMIQNPLVHADNFQCSNGASCDNLIFNRLLVAQADGVAPAQGIPFGGGGQATIETLGGGTANAAVYCDDGSGTGTPGNTCTVVAISGGTSAQFQSGASGAHVYIVAGGNAIPFASNVKLTCSSGTCLGKTTGTVSGPAISVGTPGAPVAMYVANNANLQINGMASSISEPNGTFLNGSAGTSAIQQVTAVQHSPSTFSETQFTGTITGNQLVASGLSNNIPGASNTPLGAQMTLRYTGGACAGTYATGCGVIASGPNSVAGTYTLSGSPGNVGPVTMFASFAFPLPSGTVNTFRPGSCSDANANIGTMAITGVHYQGGTSGSPCPPANFTTTHAFYGNASVAGSDFALGVIPQTTLEAIPRSTWIAYTDAQVLAAMCRAMLPASGGVFDAGGGNWYGAFTGTGEWNDGSGTAITGCGIH